VAGRLGPRQRGGRLVGLPVGSGRGDTGEGLAGVAHEIRHIFARASWTAVLQVVSTGAGFLTSLLLAHFLTSDEYGRYVFSFAWAGVLGALATLGLDRFLVRGMASYEVAREWRLARGLLRRTNEIVAVSSCLIAAIGCAVGLSMGGPLRGPFCIAMLLIPLTGLTLVRQGAMQALGRVVSGQFPEYFIRPVIIICAILWMHIAGSPKLSAASALAANVAAVVVAVLVGSALLRRSLPRLVAESTAEFRTDIWLKASIPMMLISGAWILNNYAGILVIGVVGGSADAGVYSVVQSAASLIVLFLVATNMPLAPIVARLHAYDSSVELERVTERIARIGFFVSVPVCVVFALFPGVILGIFGPSFHQGSTALTIVALAQLVNAAAGPAGNVLMMTRHERAALWGIGTGVILNLAIGLVLVPSLGVTGSGIAFAVSLVAWNVILVLIARARLGINVTTLPWLAVRPSRESTR
jgi:O-antigen/teichoic acid export membrane protein